MSDRPEHPAAGPPPSTPAISGPNEEAEARPNESAAPELPQDSAPGERGTAAAETGTIAAKPPPAPRHRALVPALFAMLAVVLALVGTAPFWVPALPWGKARDSAAMTARLERLETALQQQQVQLQRQAEAAGAALPRLERRVEALETKPSELDEMRRQIGTLSSAISDAASRLERLDKSAAQAAGLAASLDALGKSVQAQQAADTELATRVKALETAAQSRAGDMTDLGLALALLQIRGAIEAGRPFAAEYDAFAALAKSRPEIAAASAPLAEGAGTGVAGRGVLERELRALRPKIVAAGAGAAGSEPAAAERGWADAAMARLRGLVTVRRVDEPPPDNSAGAAVRAAERAIAGGDLARAVGSVEQLQGAPADAAAAWLDIARRRLAVEEALQRVETLLTARLGNAAASPGSPG